MRFNRGILLLIAVLVIGVLLIGASLALRNSRPASLANLPTPNGYDALLKAGSLIQKDDSNSTNLSQEQLRAQVNANSNALQIARASLTEKTQVPVEISERYMTNHITELVQLRMIASAFIAEGRLAEMARRTNDAAQAYLAAACLGINSRRGGTLIDSLVGIAIENFGTSKLQQVAPNLDAQTSAELARTLETFDANKETWNQIIRNEKYWSRRTFPGIQHRIAALFTMNNLTASQAKGEQRFNAQQTRTRMLMIQLAAQAYQLDKGHAPGKIADLVPTYLKAVPQDPATGHEMIYVP